MILARKIYYQNTRIFIFARKLTKFANFCPKNARFLHKNCPKNIFPGFFFFLGGGACPLPPSPKPMAVYIHNFISGTRPIAEQITLLILLT